MADSVDFNISPSYSGNTSWSLQNNPLNIGATGVYDITPTRNFTATIKMWGAGGAPGGTYTSSYPPSTGFGPGGGGGYSTGTYNFVAGTTYRIVIGRGGRTGLITNLNTSGATYLSGGVQVNAVGGWGSEGGGYTGLFQTTTLTQGNALIIAGGGGGGSDTAYGAYGGAGGGSSGQDSPAASQQGGTGGTQSVGGTASIYNNATNGSALTGGLAQNAQSSLGGGGGGYWGGGGGNVGGGGGGSGYIGGVTSGTTTAGSSSTPGNSADSQRNGAGSGGTVHTNGSDGRFILTFVSAPKSSISNTGVLTTGNIVLDETNYEPSSMYFNGATTSYLTSTLAAALGTGDFTIEFWINPVAITNMTYPGLIDCRTSGSDASGFALYFQSTNFVVRLGATSNNVSLTTAGITIDKWTHIALVRNSGTIYLYVDGVLRFSQANSVNYLRTNFQIGRTFDNYMYNGYMSNLRIRTTAVYTADFTPSSTPLIPTSDTVLFLKTQSTFSPQIYDVNYTSSTGTFIGSTVSVYDSTYDGYYPYNFSPQGGSLFFDGLSTYCTYTVPALGTSDFTVEFWVYPKSFTNTTYPGLFDLRSGSGSDAAGFVIGFQNTPTLNLRVGSLANTVAISGTSLTVNNWHHIAVTRASGSVKTFVNGAQVMTLTSATANLTRTLLYLGQTFDNYNYWGRMTNVRVVLGTALYTSAFTPPSTPLTAIANTSLLLNVYSNNAFTDSSANNLTVTNNGVTNTPFNPFGKYNSGFLRIQNSNYNISNYFDEVYMNSGSAYFNGTSQYFSTPVGTLSVANGNFTLEAWVNPATSISEAPVFKNYQSSTNVLEMRLVNNVPSIFYNSASATIAAASAIANNTWNHVAVTRNGSTLTLYVNGVATGGNASVTTPMTSNTAFIARNQSGSTWFNGSISNLRLTTDVMYTSNFTPSYYTLNSTANTLLLLENTDINSFAKDSGANKITVTNNGNAPFNTISPFNNSLCGSLLFNGSNQYLSITSSAGGVLDLTNKTVFTIEAWIYNNAFSTNENGIISNRSSAGSDGYDFRVNPDGSVQFYYTGGAAGTSIRSAAGTILLNTWYHVAFTRNGANAYLFINGVIVGTSTTDANGTTTAQAVWIGSSASSGATGNYFNGYITNLRVVSGTALYTTGFTPTTSVLQNVTNTKLLLQVANSANFITDSSSTPFTLTNNNTVLYKHFAPFATTSGVVQKIFLDGTLCVNGYFDETQ